MMRRVVLGICFLFLMTAVQAFAVPEDQKLKGILVDMSIRKKFLSVSVDRENTVFSVDKDTVFMQRDNRISFSDVVPGDTVEVTYRIKWRKKIAQWVQVEPSKWRKKSYRGLYGY